MASSENLRGPPSSHPSPSRKLQPQVHAVPFLEKHYSINNQQSSNILKNADFPQAIHIFFSSKKNVNLKREIFVPLEHDLSYPATRYFLRHEAVETPSASVPAIFRAIPSHLDRSLTPNVGRSGLCCIFRSRPILFGNQSCRISIISQEKIPIFDILSLTLTKNAANHMQERPKGN